MFTIYKASKNITGGAASFKVSNGGVFVEVLKQKSWDEKNKQGSFDAENKMAVYLKDVEIASILRLIGNQTEKFSTVHVQKDGTSTSVSFTPWVSNDELKGHGFSVLRGERRVSVSFSLNESELLKQFLIWALQKVFEYNMTENIKKAKNKAPAEFIV